MCIRSQHLRVRTIQSLCAALSQAWPMSITAVNLTSGFRQRNTSPQSRMYQRPRIGSVKGYCG